jgi:hypothetical protein
MITSLTEFCFPLRGVGPFMWIHSQGTCTILHLLKEVYRESDTRFSSSGFFHESIYSGPLSIPLGSFQIYTKIC